MPTSGKRVRKDAARGKLTYPGFLGVAESSRVERISYAGKQTAIWTGLGPVEIDFARSQPIYWNETSHAGQTPLALDLVG